MNVVRCRKNIAICQIRDANLPAFCGVTPNFQWEIIEEHKQLFSCFMTSRKGETYSYCKICCIEIVVAHEGKGDLPKHVKSNKHSELSETNRKITNSLTSVKGLSVVKSEGLFNKFLIQYNIPLMYHLALIK